MLPTDCQVIEISSEESVEELEVPDFNKIIDKSVFHFFKTEPVDFLTIDIGQHNLAYLAGTYHNRKLTVKEWRLIDLFLNKIYDPADVSLAARKDYFSILIFYCSD